MSNVDDANDTAAEGFREEMQKETAVSTGMPTIAIIIGCILAIILVVMYLMSSRKQKVCGGKDQLCICDGSETMTGGASGAKITWTDLDEDSLSRTMTGL